MLNTRALSLSGRWIKRVICSVLLLVLAVSFALMILSGGSGLDPDLRFKDDSERGRLSSQNDDHLDEKGDDNVRSQAAIKGYTTNDEAEICDKCCYRYKTIEEGVTELLSESELRKKDCQQRLPDAMILGVKKGGTTTLKNFISYHPDVASTQKEIMFFSSDTEFQKGMEYYRSEMMYSTPGQISMEKTPAYFHYAYVPALIKGALPNVKLLVIMRDPVKRAVSDYLHVQANIAKNCRRLQKRTSSRKCNYTIGGHFIADTFDESVIDADGQVRSSNPLISRGVYVKKIEGYLEYFKPAQILALDGEAFISDPYPVVKKVEQFLGIRDYFKRDHFYFDEYKGFFCLNKPIPNNCMRDVKGRPHPHVPEETLKKLRDYYRPYNKALNQLMNLAFRWSS